MQKSKVLHQNAVGVAAVECALNHAMLSSNVTDFYHYRRSIIACQFTLAVSLHFFEVKHAYWLDFCTCRYRLF
jgi:hypothetical protein